MNTILGDLSHPIWRTTAGLLVGYGIILGIIFVALFLLPYVVIRTV